MSGDTVEVPYERLDEELLRAVIEEFVTREGTDYGHEEHALDTKIEQVRAQLVKGKAKIVFNLKEDCCTIVPVK